MNQLNKEIFINLSLIIASYKGINKLPFLLESIEKGTRIPKEIIIVHTRNDNYTDLIKEYNKLNIILIKSDKMNQVFQRKLGINKANYDFIMQLDDDIIINKLMFEIIFDNIKNDYKNKIISANILTKNNLPADIRWVENYNKNFLFKFLIFFLNGFQAVNGNIVLKSGRPVPEILQTKKYQWLNSSLCFHRSSIEDYISFNIDGKSFYEDVYTSHNFFMRGYRLYKIKKAIITHPVTDKMNFILHCKTIKNQYRIVKDFKKSKILFLIDAFLFSIIFLIRKN